MKKPSTLLRSLSSRLSTRLAPSPAVAPWPPMRSAFDRWLAAELDELCADPLSPCTSAAWLCRTLDLAVAAQRRLVASAAVASTLGAGVDRKAIDELLDDTSELLDACAGLRDRLDQLKNYASSMHIALHWLEGAATTTAYRRALAAFAECEAVERRCGAEFAKCGSNLRKLGERTVLSTKHSTNEQCDEALAGARAVALLAIGALGAALAFRPRRAAPGAAFAGKGGASWEGALQETHKHVREEYERRRKEGILCMAELEAAVTAGRATRAAAARGRHWPEAVATARRRCGELEDKVFVFEYKVAELHRELIGVRMVLLQWSHIARGHEILRL